MTDKTTDKMQYAQIFYVPEQDDFYVIRIETKGGLIRDYKRLGIEAAAAVFVQMVREGPENIEGEWSDILKKARSLPPVVPRPAGRLGLMAACSNYLQRMAKPYPKICRVCGTGPCRTVIESEADVE